VLIKIANAFSSVAFHIAAADVGFLRYILARKEPVLKAFGVAFLGADRCRKQNR
jgi:hypothetical protein